MNKSKKQQNENYRTFEICGQTIIVDDFIYRRIFRDPDILPHRKYTFIRGFIFSHGYITMILKNKKLISITKYITRACKGEIVDHRNRNRLDNRRCNLRIVNARQNLLNRKVKNKTGLIGITSFFKSGNFYINANFRANKNKSLRFNCPDTPFNRILAALAHDKFVLQEGEEAYAPLNFPEWQFKPLRSILMKEDLSKYKEQKSKVKVKKQKPKLNQRILRFCRKMTKRKIENCKN
jgi:hypothetical protein